MTLNVPVREDILTSWQRCVVAGLRPDHFEVPYQPDFDHDGPLRWADALTAMACAATPVTDAAGEMIGVVDLTCAAEDFNPLLLPFAKHAAREIGHRLREGANLRRLPARGWLSLTDTERAVAHLAAEGSGLTGLRERAEALGGMLKLTSPSGHGTSVDVRLPAAPR